MSQLPRQVSYDEIIRGKIFNVPTPYTSQRPLDFVVEEPGSEGLFRIVQKDDGFEGEIDPVTKKRVAKTLKIVTEFKMRPAVVIQSTDINTSPFYDYVIVLPLTSIHPGDLTDPVIQEIMTYNNNDRMHYLGELLGRHALVNIVDPKRLHKNMLYATKAGVILGDDVMETIMVKFAECLSIRRIVECETCEKNCENCSYKNAVNQ